MGEWTIIVFEETEDGDYIYHCKMPENNQRVLVWYSGHPKVDICTIDKDGNYWTECGDHFAEEVSAWMPITDPHETVFTYRPKEVNK